MSTDTDKVLRNLGVIAALKQNDKLLTEGEFFAVYVPTVMRGVLRFAWGETRELNIKRIGETIDRAKTFVTSTMAEHSHMSPGDAQVLAEDSAGSMQMRLYRRTQVQQCTRVIQSLSEINSGLDNLVETYRDDAGLVVRLRNIKQEVNDFVETTQFVGRSSPVIHRLNE